MSSLKPSESKSSRVLDINDTGHASNHDLGDPVSGGLDATDKPLINGHNVNNSSNGGENTPLNGQFLFCHIVAFTEPDPATDGAVNVDQLASNVSNLILAESDAAISQQPPLQPSSLSGPVAKLATRKNTRSIKRKYEKQQLPVPELYTVNANGQFICRYKGPARRGQCSTKSANARNLGRHMRKHAVKEVEMKLRPEERVACNGMPEGLLLLKVSCPFKKEHELMKCKFYRENGKIWEAKTLERWEKVMERHRSECH